NVGMYPRCSTISEVSSSGSSIYHSLQATAEKRLARHVLPALVYLGAWNRRWRLYRRSAGSSQPARRAGKFGDRSAPTLPRLVDLGVPDQMQYAWCVAGRDRRLGRTAL